MYIKLSECRRIEFRSDIIVTVYTVLFGTFISILCCIVLIMFPTDTIISTDSLEKVVPSNNFRMMPLNKFCVKSFFEIGFIYAANIEDEYFIDQLLALNRTRENINHVTFIDDKDVKSFMETVANGNTDFDFPPILMPELKQFVQYTMSVECNDMECMAYKLKFKLIQKMYEQYGNEVKEIRRQEMLSRELDALAEIKPPTRGKYPLTKTSSKSGKKNEQIEKVDYTEVEVNKTDLVIDDLANNQVYFYVFRGFNSVDILKYLLKAAVKLSFIIKVSELDDVRKRPNHFWKEYACIRNSPCDYLQNVAVFKYQALPQEDSNPMESSLKQLIEIIKTLIDYKRMHFNYIKNLKIVDTTFTRSFKQFPVYEKMLDGYPTETITIPLIITGMLQEVQMKEDNILKSQSFQNSTPFIPRHKTKCAFNIRNLIRPVKEDKCTKIPTETFRVYEGDHINLALKSYEEVGVQYVRDNLEILSLQKPILLARECNFEEMDDYQCHTHDLMIPNKDERCFTEEQSIHLINLLYLKNRYYQYEEDQYPTGNEFTKNLLIFNTKKHIDEMVPHCLSKDVSKINEPFVDHYPDSNQYQTLRPMTLHWAEILKPEVLLQYLLDSELKYLYTDYVVCNLTNSLIVRYHNNVNSFGTTTKVWKEYLRTPVGLGDFCKFTLVDDYDWLKANRIYPQVTYASVVRSLEEHSAMHHYMNVANKYKSLLIPQIQYNSSDIRQTTHCPSIEENDCKIFESCNAYQDGNPAVSENLASILQDLEQYNNVVDYSEHCKGKSDSDYSFVAYNFGVTKFRIVGHTTDFISLDKIRVTIDTSRFCNDFFKMMVKVSDDYNSLVIHMPQDGFNCHVTLSDGTIVVFAKPLFPDEMSKTTEDDPLTRLDLDGARKDTNVSELSNNVIQELPEENEKMLPTLDFDHYCRLYRTSSNILRNSQKGLFKTNMKKPVDLLKRLQNNSNCIKVSKKPFEMMDCLYGKIPEHQVAMSSVVKRIIHDSGKLKLCDTIKRKCVLKGGGKSLKSNSVYDCTVTLPNGLTLKVLTSDLQTDTSVIKQSYTLRPNPKSISDERYRMFTKDGTIIIGKLDGSIHLLKSSGLELRFEKPTNAKDDETFCQIKKKMTDISIRKLIARMAELNNSEASEYFISRRSHLKSKYASLSSSENFADLSKLPYSLISMINFEGEKIMIKEKKLYKYQFSRNTTHMNFQTEESYYRRDDGFSAKLGRDGTQHIEFSDGTSIRTFVFSSEELISVDTKDKMGWILITSNFLCEHPYYKPVFFDNINSNIGIQINEYDSLNISPLGCLLNMKNSTQINLNADYIDYLKVCNHCDGLYKCRLFVEPLYENRNLELVKEYFVTVVDSYQKTFKADFKGNCKVDPGYTNVPVNERNCSHSLQTDHQRIYLIKSNLEGMILWNDKAASSFMEDSEEQNDMHRYYDETNKLVFLKINKNVSKKFNERYFSGSLADYPFIKSQDGTNKIAYQTTRNIYSMFELDQIDGLMNCLKKFYQEEAMRDLVLSLSDLKFYLGSSKVSINSESQEHTEEFEREKKPVISLHEKLKQNNKKYASTKNIFKMPLPNYYRSNFFTSLETRRSPRLLSNWGGE